MLLIGISTNIENYMGIFISNYEKYASPYASNNETGAYVWYKNNLIHRANDKPAIVEFNRIRWWYQDGKCHRDNDQPAMVSERCLIWFRHGKCHRIHDNPAVVWFYGYMRWFYCDNFLRDCNHPFIRWLKEHPNLI